MSGLNLHVYPSSMTNESRIERLSRSLQGSGRYAETHLVGMARAGLPSMEPLPGSVRIRRLGRPVVGTSTPLKKAMQLLRWFGAIYRTYARTEVTVVAAHSVWMLPICWALTLRTGAVLTYNPHELETESATMSGRRQRFARLIEGLFFDQCAVVSVVNTSVADWYAERYQSNRVITVRNIPVADDVTPMLRERLGLAPDDMLFIHSGNLVAGRSIPLIIDSFARQSRAHVVFLGDGSLVEDVVKAAADHPTIHHIGPVPPSHVVAHVREADVALVLIEATCLSYQLSSPNKLFEALAAGTPPLCTDLPEARRHLGAFADEWTLADASVLPSVVQRIGRGDVERFRREWPGLPSWTEEVEPLVAAYDRAVDVDT